MFFWPLAFFIALLSFSACFLCIVALTFVHLSCPHLLLSFFLLLLLLLLFFIFVEQTTVLATVDPHSRAADEAVAQLKRWRAIRGLFDTRWARLGVFFVVFE